MKAVIMAGGKGTRIASINSEVPKPMIPLCGKPVLEYEIENLRACGILDITLVIGHLGHVIKAHFGDGSAFGVKLSYFEETEPLGTAGALFRMPGLDEDFLLLCGDTILDVDFNRFAAFHREKGAWASLLAHPNSHPYDSSLLVTEFADALPGALPEDTGKVTDWISKETPRLYYRNLVNAGVQILSPQLLRVAREMLNAHPRENPAKVDLDRDVLKPCVPGGHIYAYCTTEYVKDMGTPDRFLATEADLRSGLVAAKNLGRRQKAIFLDRDGTLNLHRGFIRTPEELELIPGVAQAVKRINDAGYLAIVITNQPVIARGECSFGTLRRIHDKLETLLGNEGAYIDALYYCPHHPDRGFAGERPEYKGECDCRKPRPGMLLQAMRDYNIDPAASWMIGDSERDCLAAEAAGVRPLMVETNEPGALSAALDKMDKKLLSLR